jgi:hypothetical protein
VVVGDLKQTEAAVRALNLGEVTVIDADGNPVAVSPDRAWRSPAVPRGRRGVFIAIHAPAPHNAGAFHAPESRDAPVRRSFVLVRRHAVGLHLGADRTGRAGDGWCCRCRFRPAACQGRGVVSVKSKVGFYNRNPLRGAGRAGNPGPQRGPSVPANAVQAAGQPADGSQRFAALQCPPR